MAEGVGVIDVSQALTVFAAAGAGGGLLAAAWVAKNPVEGPNSDRLLSLLLIVCVLNIVHPLLGLRTGGHGPQVIEPLQFLLPLGLLWYLRSLRARRVFHRFDLALLVLPLAFLVVSFLPTGVAPDLHTLSVSMWVTMAVLSIGLLAPVAAEIAHYRKDLRAVYSNLAGVDPGWLQALLVALGLLFFVYAFLTFLILHAPEGFPLNQTLASLMAVVTVSLGWKSLGRRHPLPTPEEAPRESAPEEWTQWAVLIRRRLEESRKFLEPDLTLDDVAALAGLTRHETSAALNRGLGISFFDLVNGLRVGEFQRLCSLKEKQGEKVLTLALEAGFNSKPAFNAIFKKATGQTPSAYRRNTTIVS